MNLRQRLDKQFGNIFTHVPFIGRVWGKLASIDRNIDVPWTSIRKPLPECRVCLISTGGFHLRRDTPFDMGDPQGDATYRRIPSDTRSEELTITHNYYDHRDGDRDFNILLPLDRLRELVRNGFVGGLTPTHYSFMGHITGPHLKTLEEKILPQLISDLSLEEPDFVFLTPA